MTKSVVNNIPEVQEKKAAVQPHKGQTEMRA
jgi:hypothetical protein